MAKTKKTPSQPIEAAKIPTILNFTATAVIDVDAAGDGGSSSSLPRFRMLAYTGGAMRVGGWRYP